MDVGRLGLAASLAVVGLAHFVSPRVFVDHLPPEVPGRLAIVYATGAIELALASALAFAPARYRRRVGIVTAAYLVAIFPGNVYVAVAGVPVYPAAWLAWVRLTLQPLFVWWALRSTSSRA